MHTTNYRRLLLLSWSVSLLMLCSSCRLFPGSYYGGWALEYASYDEFLEALPQDEEIRFPDLSHWSGELLYGTGISSRYKPEAELVDYSLAVHQPFAEKRHLRSISVTGSWAISETEPDVDDVSDIQVDVIAGEPEPHGVTGYFVSASCTFWHLGVQYNISVSGYDPDEKLPQPLPSKEGGATVREYVQIELDVIEEVRFVAASLLAEPAAKRWSSP